MSNIYQTAIDSRHDYRDQIFFWHCDNGLQKKSVSFNVSCACVLCQIIDENTSHIDSFYESKKNTLQNV